MQTITRRQFLGALAALAALAVTPEPAEATPHKFRKCPTVRQNGITYLLYKRYAIVTKCPARKSVTIPDKIKSSGTRYTVRAIWDGAINRQTHRVVIKARHLETIEDARILTGDVRTIWK